MEQEARAREKWGGGGLLAIAPLLLAVFATGFGGLLFEILCLRRAALLLGAGSYGVGLVIAAFLLGLGLGARFLGESPKLRRRGLWAPYLLYLLTALLLPLIFGILGIVHSPWAGLDALLAFGLVFVAAFPMGGAYPHLFPKVGRCLQGRGAGLLQAFNLLGSVLGASLGAVFLLPGYGMNFCLLLCSATYFLAALLIFLLALREGRSSIPPCEEDSHRFAPRSRAFRILLCAGFATLALEIWMPRRLVFYLGGFLPTLAGTLVAVLLGFALGSLAIELLPRRRGLLRWTALVAAIGQGLALVLVETLGPSLASMHWVGPLQAMGRASLFPFLLTLPATLPLGALLPLALEEGDAPFLSARAASQALLIFSLGSVGGALLLPLALDLPGGLGLLFLPLLGALPLLFATGSPLGVLLGLVFLALLPFQSFATEPPLLRARHTEQGSQRRRIVDWASDRVTTATVVEDRVRGDRLLYTDEFTAAGGEASDYMRALGSLPHLFAPDTGGLALICLGTGRTAASLAARAGDRPLHVVEISRAVIRLSDRFDGWKTWSQAPGLRLHRRDGRRFLERATPGSLAALTLEPLLPQAPGSAHLYSQEFYEAARRALMPGGLCLQWLPTHALRPDQYRSLIRTMALVFDDVRLGLLDESTLLLGWKGPAPAQPGLPRPDLDAWLTGLWNVRDLALFTLPIDPGRLRELDAAPLLDDRPFLEKEVFASNREKAGWLAANLAQLQSWLRREDAALAVEDLRLRARSGLAHALWDPTSSGNQEAVALLQQAMTYEPLSQLVHEEWRQASAELMGRQATRALHQGLAGRALAAAERGLLLGRATPKLLATAVCALEAQGRRDEALATHARLLSWLPDYRSLPEISARRRAGFAALFAPPYLDQEPRPVDTSRWPLQSSARMRWGDPEEAFALFSRLRKGKASPEDRAVLSLLLPTLSPAALSLLHEASLADPVLARELAEKMPARLPLPPWLLALREGGGADRRAYLSALARRPGSATTRLLLDFLEADQPEPALVRFAAALLAKALPGHAPLDARMELADRREFVRKLRAQLFPGR